MEKCYYCQENPATLKRVTNPYTKEIHPTCEVCEYGFDLIKKDRVKYNLLSRFGTSFLITFIMLLLLRIFVFAILMLILGGIFKFLPTILIGNNANKRREEQRIFAKGKGLRVLWFLYMQSLLISAIATLKTLFLSVSKWQ